MATFTDNTDSYENNYASSKDVLKCEIHFV